MNLLVAAFGVLILGIGLIGLASPAAVVGTLRGWESGRRLRIAVGVRALMGVVFLFAAEACRHPMLVTVLGGLALLAAVTLPILGAKRLDAFIGWWFDRSPPFLRAWFLVALAFGVLLVWTGIP